MTRLLKGVLLAAALVLAGGIAAGPVHATQITKKELCMQACLDQNPGQQASCAIQCGLVNSGMMSQPTHDCGVEYDKCLKACGNDQKCQQKCETARMNCI